MAHGQKWPANQVKTETKGKHFVGCFDKGVGRFGYNSGLFWTSKWAVLDLDYGQFWFMGRFGQFPFTWVKLFSNSKQKTKTAIKLNPGFISQHTLSDLCSSFLTNLVTPSP